MTALSQIPLSLFCHLFEVFQFRDDCSLLVSLTASFVDANIGWNFVAPTFVTFAAPWIALVRLALSWDWFVVLLIAPCWTYPSSILLTTAALSIGTETTVFTNPEEARIPWVRFIHELIPDQICMHLLPVIFQFAILVMSIDWRWHWLVETSEIVSVLFNVIDSGSHGFMFWLVSRIVVKIATRCGIPVVTLVICLISRRQGSVVVLDAGNFCEESVSWKRFFWQRPNMMIRILPLVNFLFLMAVGAICRTLVIHREGIDSRCCGVIRFEVTS